MTARITAPQHAALLQLFDSPITVSEYGQKSNIIPSTSRKDVERYLRQGLIFEAGKVRALRGAPAMRYCNDARKAMLASLAWQASEQTALEEEGTTQRAKALSAVPLALMLETQAASVPEHFPEAMDSVSSLLTFARAAAAQVFGGDFTPDHVIAIYDRFLARAAEVKAAAPQDVPFEDLK